MANVYQPKLIQIRPRYAKDINSGDTPENITWWQAVTAGTPTASQLQTIANAFDPAWNTLWADLGSEYAQYIGSIVTDWSSDTGASYSSVGTYTPTNGTQGDLMPAQVSALISYSIPVRYRGGHGRTYLPWVGATSFTTDGGDTLADARLTAFTTHYAALYADMNGVGVMGGYYPAIYRGRTNPLKATVVLVSSWKLNTVVATQRRRLRKVAHK